MTEGVPLDGNDDISKHTPREVPPPEELEVVARPLTAEDEILPASVAENDRWKKTVSYINAIDINEREKAKAVEALAGAMAEGRRSLGSTRTADNIEKKLNELPNNESAFSREERLEMNKLTRDHALTIEREEYAKNFIDTAERAIGGNIELVLRNFDTLPEELQGAIRTGNKDVFTKYNVNPWAAKQVGRALEKSEVAEEKRIHAEKLARNEKITETIMHGDLATLSRADIEEILNEKGIAIGNIGEGIRIFKQQYEEQRKRVVETPPSPDQKTLMDRVRYAAAQGEVIPEHTIEAMLKSDNEEERLWANEEIMKKWSAATPAEESSGNKMEAASEMNPEQVTTPLEVVVETGSIPETAKSEFPNLYARVQKAVADGHEIPEHTLHTLTKSRVQSEREWAKSELAKRVSKTAVEESKKVNENVSEVLPADTRTAEEILGIVEPAKDEILVETLPVETIESQIEALQRRRQPTDADKEELRGLQWLYDNAKANAFQAERSPENSVTPITTMNAGALESESGLSPYDTALLEMWNIGGYEGNVPDWELVPMSEQELRTEGEELETLAAVAVLPFAERRLRSTYEIVDEKYRAMEEASKTPVATSETPAPAPSVERFTMNDAVVKQFEEKFGMSEELLELIEPFKKLSAGQQMLVLTNLEQVTLSDITKEAKEQQKAEWGNTPWWKKGLQSIATLGMKPQLRTAEIEKELLAKEKGENVDSLDALKRNAKKIAYIESLSRVASSGPEVEVRDGELLIKYTSPKEIFTSLEDKTLTPEKLAIIENFNVSGSEFAKIPHEWKYPTTDLTKREERIFKEKETAFMNARASMLSLLEEKFAGEGVENSTERAMIEMNKLDERVALNQLFNTHPDAETALANIQDQSVIRRAAGEFWKAKGAFVAYGLAGRAGVVSLVGAAFPPLGASLFALGAVGGAGYLVGNKIGEAEGKKLMKERRVDGRMSEEDEREEVEHARYRAINGKLVVENGELVHEVLGKRKIKEFTDATFFVDRIDRLTAKLEQATTDDERALLERKIVQTTTLMAEKLDRGMINFGGSSLEAGDGRKGDTIGNRLSFIQAMTMGEIEANIDRKAIDDEYARIIGLRESTIGEARQKEILKIARKAAVIRGGFAFAGAGIGSVVAHYMQDAIPTPVSATENVTAKIPEVTPAATIEVSDLGPVTAEELSYASAMSGKLGRPLSLIEARALWKTDPSLVASGANIAETPQGIAHAKLLELLATTKSLTEVDIANIYKNAGFDVRTGNQFPYALETATAKAPEITPSAAPAVTSESSAPSTPRVEAEAHQREPEVPEKAPSAPVEAAPRIPTTKESLDAVLNVEARVGRDLSGGEMVLVKSLKTLEVNAKTPSDLMSIGDARLALVEAMRAKGGVLSPSEMYHIMSQHGLEDKTNIIQDAELRAKLYR